MLYKTYEVWHISIKHYIIFVFFLKTYINQNWYITQTFWFKIQLKEIITDSE